MSLGDVMKARGAPVQVSIKAKLVGGFVIVNMLAGVSSLILVNQLQSVGRQYQLVADKVDRANIVTTEAIGAMYQQASAVRGYALMKDKVYIDQFHDTSKMISDLLGALETWVISEEDRQATQSLRALNDQWRGIGDRAVGLIGQGKSAEGLGVISGEGMPVTQEYLVLANALSDRYDQLAAEGIDKAARQATSARNRGIAVALVALSVGVGLGLYLASFVSRAVEEMHDGLRRLAEGDLTIQEVDVVSQDELGEMARDFNRMLRALKQLVSGIASSAHSVSSASEDLTAVAEQSASAAENAAGAVQQLAGGAAGQAQSAEEVRTTMEQLHQTIQQIASGTQQTAGEIQQSLGLLNQMAEVIDRAAESSAQVREGARKAADAAKGGTAVVERSIEGMDRIRAVVGESADRIRKLEELSLQIGKITETISGISDQTNLLALNAAIEAARAGEHGRGFAVVAEEVRKLAERSDASAREIADLITTIQQRTTEAVQAMEIGNSEVSNGSELVAEVKEALGVIATMGDEATTGIARVAEASQEVREYAQQVVKAFDAVAAVTQESTAGTQEMAAAATEVARSMGDVAPVAQQNAAAAEELSSTIEELSASSEEVSASATSLSGVARALMEQVSQFRLERRMAGGEKDELTRTELGRMAKGDLHRTAVYR